MAEHTKDNTSLFDLVSKDGDTLKWNGDFEQLKSFLETELSLSGSWSSRQGNEHEFKVDCTTMSFNKNEKTLVVNGQESEELKKRLLQTENDLPASSSGTFSSITEKTRKANNRLQKDMAERTNLFHLVSRDDPRLKWGGDFEQLQSLVETVLSLKGTWSSPEENELEFKVDSPTISFCQKTKTLVINGRDSKRLENRLLRTESDLLESSSGTSKATKFAKPETTTEVEEIKSKQDDINIKHDEKEINEARSLALQFMSENPSCIRAIPYESEDVKSLTMRLYMDTNGEEISEEIKIAANEMFKNYKIEIDNLCRRPLNKIFTPLPSSKKQKANELADLTRTIEKNLHLFESRMNVTAVQSSYKVTKATEKNIPCVRVYVLGKGKIPAGETDIIDIKEKNRVFDQAEFDVAEGYYKLTTGPPLKDYTYPLEGGVGIGVAGVDAAGTLGGFLKDERGNVYILSNQHVLHPHDAGDEKVIVQPSELDYTNKKNEAENKLTKYIKKTKDLSGEEVEKKIEKYTKDLENISEKTPRKVGKYVCGFNDNFTDEDGSKIYVDAAIASLELSDKELLHMKRFKIGEEEADRCPLYGFETNKYWETEHYKSPNGEIIDFKNLRKRIQTQDSELRFMKIGRTTEFTDEGFFDLPNEGIFLKYEHFEGIRLPKVQFSFCKDCKESIRSRNEFNTDPDNEKDKYHLCSECGKDLKNDDQVESIWAHNCFPIRKRRGCFSEGGDSGSLVFDQHGRAWGLLFGLCMNLSEDFTFSLISPLSVVLDALKKISGKQELKLWCAPNAKPADEL